jgi:hypothetical protein
VGVFATFDGRASKFTELRPEQEDKVDENEEEELEEEELELEEAEEGNRSFVLPGSGCFGTYTIDSSTVDRYLCRL